MKKKHGRSHVIIGKQIHLPMYSGERTREGCKEKLQEDRYTAITGEV